LVEDTAQRERESYKDLRGLIEATQQAIGEALAKATDDAKEVTQDSASELKEKLGELDTTVRKSAQSQSRQVTSTVRDSTRQVESLVQLYARFKALEFLMLSTG